MARSAPSGIDGRKQVRRSMLLRARLRSGAAVTDCVITNLSGDGFRAEMLDLARISRNVLTVELDGHATWEAVCQWQRGVKAGFRFTQPSNHRQRWRPVGDSNPCYRRERAVS